MKATIVFGVLLLAAIAATSADLQSDINDIISQFPHQGKPISSTKDEQVVDSQQPDNSSNDNWLKDFFEISEVKDLVDYFAQKGINAQEIFTNFVNNPNKFQIPDEAFTSGDVLSSIIKGLKSPKIKNMIKEKMQSNPDFKVLVEALKDPKFKVLFYRALNSKSALNCADCNEGQQERGFWKKVWKKVLAHGVQVSIPFAG